MSSDRHNLYEKNIQYPVPFDYDQRKDQNSCLNYLFCTTKSEDQQYMDQRKQWHSQLTMDQRRGNALNLWKSARKQFHQIIF